MLGEDQVKNGSISPPEFPQFMRTNATSRSARKLGEEKDLPFGFRNPSTTLADAVVFIGNLFEVDVCSIYLLESDRPVLRLAANVGLNRECIGKLQMGIDEGLVGLVAEQMAPISVENAAKHPRFKYFPEAGEDIYETFLGVPLIERDVLQGVLVVQTIESRRFSGDEIEGLTDIASQLGFAADKARNLV